MTNRIDLKFRELKRKGKKALIVYLTCGYPNIAATEKLVLELDRKSAVDIIELGVPFSDPLADGPVIQAASSSALKNKIDLRKIFSLVARLRKKTQIPLCLMGYYNPILSFGQAAFIRASVSCGVDGVIVPDLPPEEDRDLIKLAKKNNIATIFFLSPTSPAERIKYISHISSGFIYYVSLTGVTGARKNLAPYVRRNVYAIKRFTGKPVCVGFGLSSAGHISEVFKFADGAIVGSAVVKMIQENLGRKNLVSRVGKFVETLNPKH